MYPVTKPNKNNAAINTMEETNNSDKNLDFVSCVAVLIFLPLIKIIGHETISASSTCFALNFLVKNLIFIPLPRYLIFFSL